MSGQSNANSGEDNAVLHASLLRGTLSVKAAEMDIRRDEDYGALSSLIAPIETDYILKVESTNRVKFDESSRRRLSEGSRVVQDFETYLVSKRYVDLRNLATSMRGRAEDVVRYYHAKKASEEKSRKEGGGGGGKSGRKRSTVFGALEKVIQEPVKVVQYVTNTESSSSNLVSDLDKIFSSKGSKAGSAKKRRASSFLHEGAPMFVREVIEGVDKFYEAIYSEKRQFRNKSSYDFVQSVAERRMKIIDGAFSSLVQGLSSADLESVAKKESIPVPLEALVKSVEKFLLTDVIVEEGSKGKDKENAAATAPPSQLAESGSSIGSSRVFPKSTRHRASVLDREEETKRLTEEKELVMTEHAEEKTEEERGVRDSTLTDEGRDVPVIVEMGLLPEHPIDFGIVVAAGAIFFKSLEGRVVTMQMDMLLMLGIACGLIGYQLTAMLRPPVVSVEKVVGGGTGVPSADGKVVISPPSPPKAKETEEPSERRVPSRRNMLQKSSGNIRLSDSLRRQSLDLLQKSMRNVAVVEKEEEKLKEERLVVPAKTFPEFPEGAAIGSHLNCWSSPPCTNFQVRGPNYLKDKKKVPSGDYLFPCRGCDLFLTDNPPVNLGRNRSILNGKLRDAPTFIINYRLPWGVFLSYHEIPERFLPFLRRGQGYGNLNTPLPSTDDMPAGERAMANFLLSDTDEKNEVWKIVPVVVEGPWVVKRVVGGKPAIVGTKMPIDYVYQPPEKGLAEYLEADLDIVSSAAARNILAVVRSYTQTLTIDLGYVVQGNKKEELPEQMMLGLRLHGLDPLTAELLPQFDDGMAMPELDDDTSGYDTE